MDLFLSKIKQLLLAALVKVIKFFGKLKTGLKVILKFFFKPVWWLIKVFIQLLLPVYRLLRKLKKGMLALPLFIRNKISQLILTLGPLAILVIIGLVIFTTNLRAAEVKPEDYGKKSLLYKLSQSGETFSLTYELDALAEETEFIEGPLTNEFIPTSYLKDEAITAEEAEQPAKEEGINSLLSVTGDESALISPQITDPAVVVKKRDRIVDYQVQAGDTLGVIAKGFGLKLNTLLWENNLSEYSLIRPGQVLRVLPVDGLSYTVQAKDTLEKIAKKYKVTVDEVVEYNKLASASDLQVGQKIILPGATKVEVYLPSRSYSIRNIFQSPVAISSSKLQWPTSAYRITQYFTWRHSGIDISNKKGTPVYAAEAGVVEIAGWNRGGYGYYVIINHGGGLKTLYAHNSVNYVKVGDKVTRGQVIAAVGSTGRSTGPHVHFEVFINNRRVNPLGYVR